MAIQAQPSATATAPSAPREQSLSSYLHAEVMVDLDDGRPTLVAATEANLGDLRETSPARLLRMVADARAKLDDIEHLAKVFEAEDTIRAILAEHDLTMVEVDMAKVAVFGEDLTSRLSCWAGKDNGRLTVWVPKGQDRTVRANALAALANTRGSVVREG